MVYCQVIKLSTVYQQRIIDKLYYKWYVVSG